MDNIGNVGNVGNVGNRLKEAYEKLKYITETLKNCDCDCENEKKYKEVILLTYMHDITKSVNQVCDEIDERYEQIKECDDYSELYRQLKDSKQQERKFINDFGPSMLMWHVLQ